MYPGVPRTGGCLLKVGQSPRAGEAAVGRRADSGRRALEIAPSGNEGRLSRAPVCFVRPVFGRSVLGIHWRPASETRSQAGQGAVDDVPRKGKRRVPFDTVGSSARSNRAELTEESRGVPIRSLAR